MQSAHKNDIPVISLPANLTQKEAQEFMTLALEEKAKGNTQIVVDASGMTLIDSSGIGALVQVLKLLRSAGGDLVLRNLQGSSLEVFRDSGLETLFTIEREGSTKKATEDLFKEAIDLKLETNYKSKGDIGILHLSGMINTSDAIRKLKEQILLALADKKKIVLDMENLTFLDSAAVGEVMSIRRLLQNSGGDLCIAAANELIQDLFQTLNLDAVVLCVDTVDQAVANW